MSKYVVEQELKSGTMLNSWLFLFDFVFIIVYFGFFAMLRGLVHPVFEIPYHIFNVVVAFILTKQSPFNRGKRIYQTVWFALKREKIIYRPVIAKREGQKNAL